MTAGPYVIARQAHGQPGSTAGDPPHPRRPESKPKRDATLASDSSGLVRLVSKLYPACAI